LLQWLEIQNHQILLWSTNTLSLVSHIRTLHGKLLFLFTCGFVFKLQYRLYKWTKHELWHLPTFKARRMASNDKIATWDLLDLLVLTLAIDLFKHSYNDINVNIFSNYLNTFWTQMNVISFKGYDFSHWIIESKVRLSLLKTRQDILSCFKIMSFFGDVFKNIIFLTIFHNLWRRDFLFIQFGLVRWKIWWILFHGQLRYLLKK